MLSDLTNEDDFRDFESFYRNFYDPVCAILRSCLRVPDHDVDDLAQRFFTKVLEKDLLEHRNHIQTFRGWLFASVKNHALDDFRRKARSRETSRADDSAFPSEPPDWPEAAADEDSIYALCILNMTLQKMRSHCEATGKGEIWAIFDHWVRARVNEERRGDTADELSGLFPGQERSTLWNKLTTAKRIFRRMVREVIPAGFSSHSDSESRFREWLEIMMASPAAKQDRLSLAFRVDPLAPPDASELLSIYLVVRSELFSPEAEVGEIPAALREDELRILLSFRLATPLGYYVSGMMDAVGACRTRRKSVAGRPARPLCMETLLTSGGLAPGIDLAHVCRRIKASAKWNHQAGGDGIPRSIQKMTYNLAIALVLVESGSRITALSDLDLAKNFRWAASRPWIDDRLRPVFDRAIALVNSREVDPT